jgi:Tfp pilus assembly protein PilF
MEEQVQDKQRVIDLLLKLGKAYIDREQYSEAIQKLKKGLELGGDSTGVLLNLSKAYILNEQYDEEAVETYRRVLEFEPDNKVINIILSQIYSEKSREDEEALNIYQRAFQHNPSNARNLLLMILKIHCKNKNYNDAKQLVTESITTYPTDIDLLQYYVYLGWKDKSYKDVNQKLRYLLNQEIDPFILKLLIINNIKSFQDSTNGFSTDDYHFIDHYLKSINKFENLNDIYIFLSLRKIINNLPITISGALSEFELFLADNSFSNIWEKGLSTPLSADKPFNFLKDIWQRIKNNNDILESSEDKVNIDLLKSLMIIQIVNYDDLIQKETTQELLNNFNSLISSEVNPIKNLAKRHINDGYIILSNDPVSIITTAIKICKRSFELYKGTDPNNTVKFKIIVHHRISNQYDELFNDINTIFEIQQFGLDLYSWKNLNGTVNNNILDLSNKICITESTLEVIKEDEQLKTKVSKPLDLPETLQLPSLYEIKWSDLLDPLKANVIKNVDRFHILNNIIGNELFESFKAVDTFLDRLIILKILQPQLPSDTFIDQASHIGKINHKNITTIYDIGKDNNYHYIAREYVEGISLTTIFEQKNEMNLRLCFNICQQICRALQQAHKAGFAHGRIKPNNIFIAETNEIKLSDFTIPDYSYSPAHLPSLSLVALSHLAPEQITNFTYDHRSDIYSIGVLLYEMLTMRNPFYNENRPTVIDKIQRFVPDPISSQKGKLNPAIDSIVAKAIEKSPEKRYENIGQLMAELQNYYEKYVVTE